MARSLDQLLEAISGGEALPVYLIHGDLVVAEPAGRRVADALAERASCEVAVQRHPPRLTPILDDLRTYALFESAKVILVIGSAALAEKGAAAALIDEAAAVLPIPEGGDELSSKARQGASRLLQALRLFDIDPQSGSAEEAIESLPKDALVGAPVRGRRKRTAAKIRDLKTDLAALLEAAREAELVGWAEGDLAVLGEVVRGGLPDGHSLVLAEASVSKDSPIVSALVASKAVVSVGQVATERRGGWSGLDALSAELERQTGVAIERAALEELARRTLRQVARSSEIDADSTARLAGEYRKLASLTGGRRIDRAAVMRAVEDRGEQDVWKVLDAVGEGKAREAQSLLRRLLAGAPEPMAARLSFFSLLATFCRHLTAVRGMMRIADVPEGQRAYNPFKSRWAEKLQGEIPDGAKNPLAGLHPFRLHKAYLAACRMPESVTRELPALLLETELQLKGESKDADGALLAFVARLASA